MGDDPYGLLDAWNYMGDNSVPTQITDSSGNSPFNMSTASSGMGFVGDFLGYFGALQEGKSISQLYDHNADLTLAQADFNASQLETHGEYLMGTQKAMYAKAGVTMSGSPLDVMLESATNIELDKQIMRFNANSKADMDKYYGKQAIIKSKFEAGSDLIKGVMDLGKMAMAAGA